jgi:hypothetical protein
MDWQVSDEGVLRLGGGEVPGRVGNGGDGVVGTFLNAIQRQGKIRPI